MDNFDNLMPITRQLLCQHYEKYPISPPDEELCALRRDLGDACRSFGLKLPEKFPKEGKHNEPLQSSEEKKGLNEAVLSKMLVIPHKLDENIWRSRQQLEEILYLLDDAQIGPVKDVVKQHTNVPFEEWNALIENIQQTAERAFDTLQNFQKGGMKKVQNLISTFLPNDFRMSIVKAQQDRSEAHREAQIQALVDAGGSIKQKYDLYWQLQLQRRETLVHIGNATGAYRAILKYIGGVPQVLLDFIKTVNDNNGPMEELRVKYGPNLYFLTELISVVFLLLATVFYLLLVDDKDDPLEVGGKKTLLANGGNLMNMMDIAQRAIVAYDKEIELYLKQQLEILESSPFFISKDEVNNKAGSAEERETIVSKIHEVLVQANHAGDEICWDWFTRNKDIEFCVTFQPSEEEEIEAGGRGAGEVVVVLERQRYDSHLAPVRGSSVSPGAGVYRLVWDNSYSWLAKKNLVYRAWRRDTTTDVTICDEKQMEGAINEIMSEQQEGSADEPPPTTLTTTTETTKNNMPLTQ